jgi:hypothetical protein
LSTFFPFPLMMAVMPTFKTGPGVVPAFEIEPSELRAVRNFLTSYRDEERLARRPSVSAGVTRPALRNGIARARLRSASKPEH